MTTVIIVAENSLTYLLIYFSRKREIKCISSQKVKEKRW